MLGVADGGLEMDDTIILCKIAYTAHQISQAAHVGYWDDDRREYHIERLREDFKQLVELMEEMK